MKNALAPLGRDCPVLVVDELSKSFRGKPAIRNVSFSVPEASLTVILGPAGAGKTTTLRIIAGLDRPDSGSVLLGGQDVGGWEPKDRNIAMILDNLALYPNKTGFENIASPLIIRRVPWPEIETRVAEIAATLKISHILKRLPKTMSGGERQRIALGRALIRTPILFLLDEPLSSLDAMLRIELRAELKRLQRELGYSFLMATPDYNEALAIADTVVMLREGRVIQTAKPQDIYDDPVDREVARFVGSPLINIVPARYVPEGDGGVIETAGARLPLPPHMRRCFGSESVSFELGIRPENLELALIDTAPVKATLTDIEPLGLKSVLTVRNDAAELRLLVETMATRDITPGQPVGILPTNISKLLAFDAATGERLGG